MIKPELAADLTRLKDAKIPIDIRFEQGLDVLGLTEYATPSHEVRCRVIATSPGAIPCMAPTTTANTASRSRDEAVLFERLILEINQAGLSWETMLKKRDGFRRAYRRLRRRQGRVLWRQATASAC